MDKKKLFFIINNLFIFITMAIAVIVVLTYGSRGVRLDGTVTEYWQQIFTFTIESNIFLGIVALFAAILQFVAIKKQRELPSALKTWYLTAATAGMVTCLTVLFFLAPMRAIHGKNYFDMLLEPMFFLHFLNPILSAITFIFLFPKSTITIKSRLLATTPFLLYAIFYITFVVITKLMPDFYGMTFGGKYYLTPLVFVAFWSLAFGVSSLLSFLHRKIQ